MTKQMMRRTRELLGVIRLALSAFGHEEFFKNHAAKGE